MYVKNKKNHVLKMVRFSSQKWRSHLNRALIPTRSQKVAGLTLGFNQCIWKLYDLLCFTGDSSQELDPLVTSFKLETMCSPTLQACQTEETEIKEISMARESPSYQTAETTDTHRDESSSAAKVSSSTQAGKHLHVIFAFIGLICSTGTSSIVNYLL